MSRSMAMQTLVRTTLLEIAKARFDSWSWEVDEGDVPTLNLWLDVAEEDGETGRVIGLKKAQLLDSDCSVGEELRLQVLPVPAGTDPLDVIGLRAPVEGIGTKVRECLTDTVLEAIADDRHSSTRQRDVAKQVARAFGIQPKLNLVN